ncbi:hypothetical protein ACN9MU_20175 [Pseudoduganella sp. R-32]|uniref:hypothetical protein n=1 Tax=Pseudoduganella sp. R-32 TaxID=3404061 RepID=UPI003CF1A9E8
MSFDDLMTDSVSILKADGRRFDDIPACVQSRKIFINRVEPIIEPTDLVLRKMSNGGEETFKVIDPGFHERFHDIPAGYQLVVEKLGLPDAQKAVQSITYNVHGNNARINHQSVDNSTNVVQDSADVAQLITELRRAIEAAGLSASAKADAAGIVEAVEAQFSGAKPKRSVITAMLAALPDVASIASCVNALVALAN